jgi:hypothetical protein
VKPGVAYRPWQIVSVPRDPEWECNRFVRVHRPSSPCQDA